MAVAAMTIAWGGCTTCVERNLHWYSTRVDGGMCSCGTPQSGSDITGLVSPGFVLRRVRRARGWGGGLRGRCDRVEHAATAEERAVCMACMACCSGAAPDSRAATSRDDGGKLLGSAAQHGAGCGVQCTRSAATGAGATGAGCEGAVCAADAISAATRLRRAGPW